ncbi:MAG TPA: hypothetical protein VFU02_16885 [Polyangiaceae bacterium]|nr:hypothetical protein [Polyangiaceae bacterium]
MTDGPCYASVDKLLLMSVIFATVLIPAWTQRYRSPKRGLRKTITLMMGFNAIYLLLYLFLWPRLLWSG